LPVGRPNSLEEFNGVPNEQGQRILTAYSRGEGSIREIAKKEHVPKSVVGRLVKKHGDRL